MRYPLLEKINSPEDLKALSSISIPSLCEEIRAFLIETTEKNGGHLASNLGVVEATVALHRVFSSPKDRIIFDVGHQSYIHKLITGRRELFSDLRVPGGLSGFTKREESIHDPFGAGHSSTSISAALGFCEADRLSGEDRYNVAVIGDGAFTGGMVHEALNNVDKDLPLIILLNENGMSISSNKGAFASYLSRFRASSKYQKAKKKTKSFVMRIPLIGKPIKGVLTFVKRKLKSLLLPVNYFEELGLQYIGPVNGNNYEKVEKSLLLAKNLHKAVVVHIVTVKGKGYFPAEISPSGYHTVATADKISSFHDKAADKLIELARDNEKIVAVTAAMGIGTGLERFGKLYENRYFDVGIAEQHALTFCAGLAAAGLSPYIALYSTFLQRGYDNILHDIALQNLPVKILVDRAGLSIGDGPTHHGIFDVSLMLQIPSVRIFAPICYSSLERIIEETACCDSPVAIRYPNSSDSYFDASKFAYLSDSLDSLVLSDFSLEEIPDTLFVTYGKILEKVTEAKEDLSKEGRETGILIVESLNPCKKLIELLYGILSKASRVLFVEEGIQCGGFSSNVIEKLCLQGFNLNKTKVSISAIDGDFASPKTVCDLYSHVGLSKEKLSEKIKDD